jgi:hypothetical protein
LAIAGSIFLSNVTRSAIPDHLLNHPVEYTPNLISENTANELNKLVREMEEFPSNIASDLKTGNWNIRHLHVGEAQASKKRVNNDSTISYSCDHPFMVPSQNKDECSLPQRVDVGRHFVLTGGADGARESFQSTIQRVTSFGRYFMKKNSDPSSIFNQPIVQSLFDDEKFQDAAKRICPKDKQILDTFQFNVIMQIPGQTVAAHIDSPYFWGAGREDFPQWLLAVMVFSNLFHKDFIDQVQVVGYLSDINNDKNNDDIGGEFLYYLNNNEGRYDKVAADYRAGSAVDGSKLVHASRIYKPSVKVPYMSKDSHSALKYVGGEKWNLVVDDKVIAEYTSSELRVSIVYRARCFTDEDELKRYEEYPQEKHMDLESVLHKLKLDLIQKNIVSKEKIENMDRLEFAILLISEYIKYPLPSIDSQPYMPWNYCAITKLYPWLGEVC